jgi:hypothetical protein
MPTTFILDSMGLLDSMINHGAWAVPLFISIKRSMCDTGRFVDLTDGDKAGSNSTVKVSDEANYDWL